MTTNQVSNVVGRIQALFEDLGNDRIQLKVVEEDTKFEDEWLYVAVSAPPATGIRVSDYAELLSRVEKALRDDGIEKVLLVPVRD